MEYIGRILSVIVGIIMFFYMPILNMMVKSDQILQVHAQTAVEEFVNECGTTGMITSENYEKLVDTLSSSGLPYDITIEHDKEVVSPKLDSSNNAIIGETPDTYYVATYENEILSQIYPVGITSGATSDIEDPIYYMNVGDTITVTAVSDTTYGGKFMTAFGLLSGSNSKIVVKYTKPVTKVSGYPSGHARTE